MGYDLFLMVISLTAFYVLVNAFSIVQYAVAHHNYAIVDSQSEPQAIIKMGIIFLALGVLFVFLPFEFTGLARWIRRNLGTSVLKAIAVDLASLDITLFAMVWQQAIPPLDLFEKLAFLFLAAGEIGVMWLLMMKDDP